MRWGKGRKWGIWVSAFAYINTRSNSLNSPPPPLFYPLFVLLLQEIGCLEGKGGGGGVEKAPQGALYVRLNSIYFYSLPPNYIYGIYTQEERGGP
jgi:hypothetical protein